MPGPGQRAVAWLDRTYRGLLELAAPHPVHESATAWLMACRTVHQPVMLFDGSSEDPVSFDPTGVHALHVIRYR
ncbi:hypothetical protein [Streptomyces sp. NPDC060366]|uniref:hypothetical protein n=1 Tax=Streptomyces sp. NPDC060366 TaxID=3347105 RepID=UPI0036492020